MKTHITLLLCLLCTAEVIVAQQLKATEVLEKALAYHDPNGTWEQFNSTFQVTMTTPNNAARVSDITINLPNQFFNLAATRDGNKTTYTIDKGTCTTSITETVTAEGARTPCEMASFFQNYYTYLFGLPMKLKDPGTNLSETVETVIFKDKEYFKLKVTYDEAVGGDVWFFYFNPTTFAMEVYQFFKGDPNGDGKDTGEYILLSEEYIASGIKMPKVRAWYYNKDNTYLGTDTITN